MAEVYVLTFPNGKQYVGRTKKTADVRFRNHVRNSQKSKMPVHRAIRKFGAENVKVAILADGLSWSESAKVEIAWIAKLGTMMPGGYNLTAGGEGRLGCPASEAVRAAVAAANRRRRGKPLSEANRQGIAEATIVSADDVRRALGCEFDPKKEGQVWFVVETAVRALLMRGQNVILDCNNHTVKQRRVWLRLRDLANVNFLSFPTPPEAEWKRRCQESNFRWSVIERMKAEYQPLTPGEQT